MASQSTQPATPPSPGHPWSRADPKSAPTTPLGGDQWTSRERARPDPTPASNRARMDFVPTPLTQAGINIQLQKEVLPLAGAVVAAHFQGWHHPNAGRHGQPAVPTPEWEDYSALSQEMPLSVWRSAVRRLIMDLITGRTRGTGHLEGLDLCSHALGLRVHRCNPDNPREEAQPSNGDVWIWWVPGHECWGYRVHVNQTGWAPPKVRLCRSECPKPYRLGGIYNPTLAKWECMVPKSRAE